jgi:hypothetical protein
MKAAQRQFLVKVSGIDGYFMTKSGGNVSADTNKVYDGGSLIPEVMSSPAEVDNITVGRAYDAGRDEAMLHDMRKRVGRFRTTISVTPTDEDLRVNGKAVVYSDALLVGVTEMDYDSAGGDPASFEFEFAVGSIA